MSLSLQYKGFVKILLFFIIMLALSACSLVVKPSKFEPSWMTYNQAKKQVNFDIVSAWNANNNGYNFNGYYQGAIELKVPADWQVRITMTNLDANAPHSMILTDPFSEDDIPDELVGEFAIFNRAYIDTVFANESSIMQFKAKAGDYWLFCGIKGHGVNGMWIKLKADPDIKMPMVDVDELFENGRR